MILLLILSALGQAKAVLECLHCKGVLNPQQCNTFTVCGENQVCHLDNYITSDGHTRFDLGCRERQHCPASIDALSLITTWLTSKRDGNLSPLKTGTLMCSECCFSTLCNKKGCGEMGHSNKTGPICTNCGHHNTTNDCNKYTVCDQNEVCKIERATDTLMTFGQYVSGCESRQMCTYKKDIYQHSYGGTDRNCDIICCTEDLCNSKCIETTSLHPCLTNPCRHGNCSLHGDSYICTCNSGYHGQHCDQTCSHLNYTTSSYQVGNHMQDFQYAIVHQPLTYSEALQYCEAHCGQLVKILTSEKFDFIHRILRHGSSAFFHTHQDIWVDGKADLNGVWKTSTGENLTTSQHGWAYPPHTSDQCASLEVFHPTHQDCGSKHYPLCEKATPTTQQSITTLPPTTQRSVTTLPPTTQQSITTLPPTTQRSVTTLPPQTQKSTTMPPQTTTMKPNACHSNPCQHGGTCSADSNNNVTCKCSSHYHGDRCTEVCPPYHTLHFDHHYVKFGIITKHMTYSEAEQYCRSHCGQLLHALTGNLLQAFKSYLVHENIAHTYWINGQRDSHHIWKTSSGQNIPLTHELWAQDPSHHSSRNCAALEDDANFHLVNYSCSNHYQAICQAM